MTSPKDWTIPLRAPVSGSYSTRSIGGGVKVFSRIFSGYLVIRAVESRT